MFWPLVLVASLGASVETHVTTTATAFAFYLVPSVPNHLTIECRSAGSRVTLSSDEDSGLSIATAHPASDMESAVCSEAIMYAGREW